MQLLNHPGSGSPIEDGAKFVDGYLDDCIVALNGVRGLKDEILRAGDILRRTIAGGGKVLFCGNGGSAADAQHLAAELMGRFLFDRDPLPAMALSVDTSALTAIGNDYGFELVFARQLRGIAVAGDALVGLSTSGNSPNVVRALEVARAMNIATIGLTGAGGGRMAALCDVLIAVPDRRTSHIQEAQIAIGHMICAMVEERLCSRRR